MNMPSCSKQHEAEVDACREVACGAARAAFLCGELRNAKYCILI